MGHIVYSEHPLSEKNIFNKVITCNPSPHTYKENIILLNYDSFFKSLARIVMIAENFINLLGVFCDNIVLLPFTSTHNCQRNETNQGFSLNDSF